MNQFFLELYWKLRYTPLILKDAFTNPYRVRNILWMLGEIFVGVLTFDLARDLGFLWAYILAAVAMFLIFEYFASLPSIGLTSWYWERGPREGEGSSQGHWPPSLP